MSWRIIVADALEGLRSLPAESVHCIVTSPPYWGLRDYGADGQLGLEPTPEEYVENVVMVFQEARRVLRADGTLWLNMGDSYATQRNDHDWLGSGARARKGWHGGPNLKPKDLCGIPWRVAFALQADGWYLRSDIVWAKPNPMPESVTDRPTKAHEYVFLLTKRERYFWDQEAVREDNVINSSWNYGSEKYRRKPTRNRQDALVQYAKGESGWSGLAPSGPQGKGRNARSVWTITTKPFPGAHFATFPPELPERCIRAGTSECGCCPECGAPWERVVERESADFGMGAAACGHQKLAQTQGSLKRNRTSTGHTLVKTRPISESWSPTCNHYKGGDDEARGVDEEGVDSDAGVVPGLSPGRDRGAAKVARRVPGLAVVPCTVLDPFTGSGTTGMVALQLGRRFVGIELSPEYAAMAEGRIGEACAETVLERGGKLAPILGPLFDQEP